MVRPCRLAAGFVTLNTKSASENSALDLPTLILLTVWLILQMKIEC